MERGKLRKRISAVVPAYNEAERIADVLEVLLSCDYFEEIIVVDDGSTDHTQHIAKRYPVFYLRNSQNRGKGNAMNRGVIQAKNEIIFFSDADIIGLTPKMIDELISPVALGEVEMCIGMCDRKSYFSKVIPLLVPHLGGQRALTKNLWKTLPPHYKQHFRIEVGLNFYAHYYGKGFKYKIIKDLSQIIKEEKYGVFEGAKRRAGMVFDVFWTQVRLYRIDLPDYIKQKRKWALVPLKSFLGAALGGAMTSLFYLDVLLPSAIKNFLLAAGATSLIICSWVFLFTFNRLTIYLKSILRRIKNRTLSTSA